MMGFCATNAALTSSALPLASRAEKYAGRACAVGARGAGARGGVVQCGWHAAHGHAATAGAGGRTGVLIVSRLSRSSLPDSGVLAGGATTCSATRERRRCSRRPRHGQGVQRPGGSRRQKKPLNTDHKVVELVELLDRPSDLALLHGALDHALAWDGEPVAELVRQHLPAQQA